jgi:ATP-binding cassette subfamily F protein 3
MTLPPKLKQVEAQLTEIEHQLGDPDVYENSDRLSAILEQQDDLLTQYERLGGDRHESRIRGILAQLGFTPDDFDLPTETLSGGQKKLIALTLLATEQPDILLLDEPDNHLDLDAKQHLETFIRSYDGAVVIVSHDRYLLDEVVNQIAELENGKLTIYPGTYTAYAEEREMRRLRQQQVYLAQQKEINRQKEIQARFELWAKLYDDERFARKARSRKKMVDRLENSEDTVDRVIDRKTMGLQLEGWRGSTKALAVENLTMGFDDDLLFLELDLLVQHGERVGLIGPNGAGKSVLFRLILGELNPMQGAINIGPSTRVGYYSQEHQTLDGWLKRTPIELIRDIQPMAEGSAVNYLMKFAFTYEQTRQQIGSLSGGERSRIQLMRIMLQQPNLLLLDEPTNNLDIESVEVLESQLQDFEGAILAISHDRYFLDRIADRVLRLEDGALTGYIGGYTDYLEATGKLPATK